MAEKSGCGRAAQLASLEQRYLSAADERGGSGFTGDAARWYRARHGIMAAVHRGGTFLDVGCANGLLLESVTSWAAEQGHTIEPAGLDVSRALAERARARVPQWADRIYVGDVMTWEPPRRFDFVRTELVYARDHLALVQRCLERLVADDGRLILCSYGNRSQPPSAPADVLRQCGLAVVGIWEGHDEDGALLTRIAWTEHGATALG